jgi:hypothetical protein
MIKIDPKIEHALYYVPEHIRNPIVEHIRGTSFVDALEPEDIEPERVAILSDIVRPAIHSVEENYIRFEAARILCSWGYDLGLERISDYIDDEALMDGVLSLQHRLRVYNQAYEFAMGALIRYWTHHADSGNDEAARKNIYAPLCKIIEQSNIQQFEISRMFWFVYDQEFDQRSPEYYEPIKNHLAAIIDNPDFHHWKIMDAMNLVNLYDPEFVTGLLKARGKKLEDYDLSKPQKPSLGQKIKGLFS